MQNEAISFTGAAVPKDSPATHPTSTPIDRRSLLARAAGAGAAGLLLGRSGIALQAPGSVPGAVCNDEALGPLTPELRRLRSYRIRVRVAEMEFKQPLPCHDSNGDEQLYPDRRGNFSKSLLHDAIGEVVPSCYDSLLTALQSGDPDDFEAVQMGNPGGSGSVPGNENIHKLNNPQSGLSFDLEGADSHALTVPAAPAFASAWAAGEAIELAWMAHLRDVPFRQYDVDPLAAAALADLNAASDFRGPKQGGVVTPQTLFRDPFPGCLVGPYLSQFFYQQQSFGAQAIDVRANVAAPGLDYMTTQAEWLARQNGVNALAGNVLAGPAYMRNGRDIGSWVHIDVLFQAYFQAFLVMAARGVPPNPGNPYLASLTQLGFGTFGGPFFAGLVCEVAGNALRTVWFQKWYVHRRLRPEVYLGRTHIHLSGQKVYDQHPDILNSAGVAQSFSRNGTYLLPMAFPEGSPSHPAYGAGHATVAGACVTILKALFDTERPVTDFFTPLEPNDAGTATLPYAGADIGQMTIAGELNKIASNVATGRNIAGVHWRTDGEESLKLGEAAAIRLLQNKNETFHESGSFTFTKFDGTPITIS